LWTALRRIFSRAHVEGYTSPSKKPLAPCHNTILDAFRVLPKIHSGLRCSPILKGLCRRLHRTLQNRLAPCHNTILDAFRFWIDCGLRCEAIFEGSYRRLHFTLEKPPHALPQSILSKDSATPQALLTLPLPRGSTRRGRGSSSHESTTPPFGHPSLAGGESERL
jgi:hypothetical protein